MKKRNHSTKNGRFIATFDNVTNMELRIIEDSDLWNDDNVYIRTDTSGTRSVVDFNAPAEQRNDVAWLVNQARAA